MKYLLLLSVLVAFSCNSRTDSSTPSGDSTQNAPSEQILGAYFDLKNALVESDSNSAQKAGETLASVISNQEEELPELAAQAQKIKETVKIKEQRIAFEKLSNEVVVYCKSKPGKEKAYVQYCPMAFDFKGASWVSDSKEIKNPYFGDKMLKCGKVTEEL